MKNETLMDNSLKIFIFLTLLFQNDKNPNLLVLTAIIVTLKIENTPISMNYKIFIQLSIIKQRSNFV